MPEDDFLIFKQKERSWTRGHPSVTRSGRKQGRAENKVGIDKEIINLAILATRRNYKTDKLITKGPPKIDLKAKKKLHKQHSKIVYFKNVAVKSGLNKPYLDQG
ncbi:MAG: hypothetical protein LBF22_02585 [Deltaproteobacteria bacterium]|jgi:hypothetical protein|nr:hypothetical protein [Deltaproteobacteria bacterium]